MISHLSSDTDLNLILSEMLSWRLQKEIFGITDITENKLNVF